MAIGLLLSETEKEIQSGESLVLPLTVESKVEMIGREGIKETVFGLNMTPILCLTIL